jgi:hypothetical protein
MSVDAKESNCMVLFTPHNQSIYVVFLTQRNQSVQHDVLDTMKSNPMVWMNPWNKKTKKNIYSIVYTAESDDNRIE